MSWPSRLSKSGALRDGAERRSEVARARRAVERVHPAVEVDRADRDRGVQTPALGERGHHLLGEQPCGLARIAAEELDHESGDAVRAVALDPLDHAVG